MQQIPPNLNQDVFNQLPFIIKKLRKMRGANSYIIFCQNCSTELQSSIYQTHISSCYAFQNKKTDIRGKKQQQPLFLHSRTKNQIQDFKIIKNREEKRLQNIDAKIPCVYCQRSIPLQIYDIHELDCLQQQNTQCKFCKIVVPEYLILQHNKVCKELKKVRTRRFYKQQFDGYMSQDSLDVNAEQQFQASESLSKLFSNIVISEQKEKKQGLTKAQIEQLPKILYRKEKDCPICYTKMKKIFRRVRLPCKHSFHKSCIIPWLKENPLCPMCRKHALDK